MKTILGTGQLGIAVMEALLNKDSEQPITLVNREGKLNMALPKNVKLVSADVTSKAQMESLAMSSDVIFSCTDVPYQLWAKFYPATANALAHALSKTNVKVVFADNMYSYGNVKGAVMHERLPHSATTKKGSIRASVIRTLLLSGDAYNSRLAIVKAADFIGPRIYKGLFGTDFLERLHSGKKVILSGNINLPHTFTYIHDFASALINVGGASDAFGQIWHVPNAPAMTLDKWIHLFEVVSGHGVKKLIIPKFVVRVAGLFDPLIRQLYELAYQFEYPYLVDHSKYVTRFGDHSTYPSAIVKETIQHFQSSKQNENK